MVSPQKKGRLYEQRKVEGEITIPASGAGLLKEDRKSAEELIQDKLTTKGSYSIKLLDLQKLEREAALVSREPRFDIAFEVGHKLHEYVLVPKRRWEQLRDD